MKDMREKLVKEVNKQTEPMGFCVWDYPRSIEIITAEVKKDQCCITPILVANTKDLWLDAVMP
tara:strand:+ start:1789 stop:1977 length:189 start_codon:yes stop_codon:yes gene_type:complete